MQQDNIIDRTALAGLVESLGGDLQFFGEMLDTFFEDSPRQLAAIGAGLAAGDAESVRRAAHSLKSNCANFGALILSGQCRELEMLAKTGNLEDGADLLTRIAARFEQVRIALEAIREAG